MISLMKRKIKEKPKNTDNDIFLSGLLKRKKKENEKK